MGLKSFTGNFCMSDGSIGKSGVPVLLSTWTHVKCIIITVGIVQLRVETNQVDRVVERIAERRVHCLCWA